MFRHVTLLIASASWPIYGKVCLIGRYTEPRLSGGIDTRDEADVVFFAPKCSRVVSLSGRVHYGVQGQGRAGGSVLLYRIAL